MIARKTKLLKVKLEARHGAGRAKRGARRAKHTAREAAANPVVQLAERAGYVVRGLLYAAMGILALAIVIHAPGRYTDQRGALGLVPTSGAGRLLLGTFVIAIGAYSLWGFVRAFFDPLRRGDDPVGLASRAGFLWSGIAYASLTLFAAQRLAALPTSRADGVQQAALWMMHAPAGRWITIGIGLVGMVGGLAQFADAYLATFDDYMQRRMPKAQRRLVEWLGRAGMVSRGVVFTLVGWFLVSAGIHANPSFAHGFGAAFAVLAGAPFGYVLLAFVAIGFVALGLHSLACARWIRLLSDG